MSNQEKMNELKEGLFILELDERLEIVQLASAAAASVRCDSKHR
jgi:hypothetical protein